MRAPKPFLAVLLILVSPAAWAAVEMKEEPGKIAVHIGGKPFTQYVYQGASQVYFYPIFGPGGVKMTRGFPMEDLPGEEHDHPHHRSLWFGHGDVNGVDFWTEQATHGSKVPKMPLGKVVHEKFLKVQGGDKEGIIVSQNRWEAADGSVPLTSVLTTRFYERPETERLLDFEVTLIAGEKEVTLGDTKEGTMAIRVAESMRVKPYRAKTGLGHLTNNEGLKDGETWGKEAKWVDYSGPVDGKLVGIALFDHPSNLRHPTRWMARDYGLLAASPFCEHEMDKSQPKGAGSFTLKPCERLTLKYRIYIHEGDDAQANVAAHYDEYAKSSSVAGDKDMPSATRQDQ